MLRVITTRGIYLFSKEHNESKTFDSLVNMKPGDMSYVLEDDDGKSIVLFYDHIVSIEF